MAAMCLTICFYSYFKELAGCARVNEDLPAGSTLGDLLDHVGARFPRLAPLRRSTLMAVGVDYQDAHYLLKEGDEVSLFPPVQGG